MAAEVEEGGGRRLFVLERNRWLNALSIALAILGPIAAVGALTRVFPAGFFGLHAFVIGIWLRLAMLRHNQRAERRERRVAITEAGVTADGRLVAARTAIANGFFQPRGAGVPTMRLVDRRGTIVFETEVERESDALEMLGALGLDAGRRRADFRGAPPILATSARQAGTILGVIAVMMLLGVLVPRIPPIAPLMPLLVIVFGVSTLFASKITVGADGVLLRWLWREELVPMKQIADVVAVDDNALAIRDRSGNERIVYTSIPNKKRHAELARNHRDAIIARILEAQQVHARGEPATESALLARGTQGPREWMATLGKLARGEGGYRHTALRTEDLLMVVEDPSAPEETRAGAALVLRGGGDPSVKERVRIAAEATASPRLRVALERVSSGEDDDDEVAEALGRLRARE